MSAKIKVIRSIDYLEVSEKGEFDLAGSYKNLLRIAREDSPEEWDVLMDFRRTQWIISTEDIFSLVEVLLKEGAAFQDKIALLILPGVNFDRELFNQLCATYPENVVRTFTNYEDAVHWFCNS
jgi:hypothetical protein